LKEALILQNIVECKGTASPAFFCKDCSGCLYTPLTRF
jgi:hypothetical protein